jgi:hypothetical protein
LKLGIKLTKTHSETWIECLWHKLMPPIPKPIEENGKNMWKV